MIEVSHAQQNIIGISLDFLLGACCVAMFCFGNMTLSAPAASSFPVTTLFLPDLFHEHFLLSWHPLLIRGVICHTDRALEAVGSSAWRWATLDHLHLLLSHYVLLHLLLSHHVLGLSHRGCTSGHGSLVDSAASNLWHRSCACQGCWHVAVAGHTVHRPDNGPWRDEVGCGAIVWNHPPAGILLGTLWLRTPSGNA